MCPSVCVCVIKSGAREIESVYSREEKESVCVCVCVRECVCERECVCVFVIER